MKMMCNSTLCLDALAKNPFMPVVVIIARKFGLCSRPHSDLIQFCHNLGQQSISVKLVQNHLKNQGDVLGSTLKVG